MSIDYRIGGVLLSSPNTVTFPDGVQGLVTAAERGAVGTGGVLIEDPDGSLTINGFQTFTVDDTDASPTRVFTGYIADRGVNRGPFRVGASRVIDCTVVDQNALLHIEAIRFIDNDGKRPAETDVAKITWLLGSRALSTLVYDHGLVSSGSPISFLASDERQQYADDIISSFISVAGKNAYVYYDAGSGQAALAYQADTNTYWAAGISLSNVSTEVNNTTVFGPSIDASLTRTPEARYGGVDFTSKGTLNTYASSASTIAAMGLTRDAIYSTDRIGHLATLQTEAQSYLNLHANEADIVTVTVDLPAQYVNKAFAGQEMSVKFTHIPGYTGGVTTRIRRRDASPIGAHTWRVRYELWIPPTVVSDAATTGGSGAPTTSWAILDHNVSDRPSYDWKRGYGIYGTPWRIPWTSNGDNPPGGWTGVCSTPLSGLFAYQSWNGEYPAGSTGSPAGGPYTTGKADNGNMGSGIKCLGAGTDITVTWVYNLVEVTAAGATVEIRKNGTTVLATGSIAGGVINSTGTISASGITVATNDVLECYAYAAGQEFELGNIGANATYFSVSGTLATAGAAPLPTAGQVIENETPVGAVDASNTAFTTAFGFIDLPANTLRVFHDGLDQTDHLAAYDGVAKTFSLDYAPSYGSVVKVFYVAS